MKQTLSVLALFIAIGFANNLSDNPEEKIHLKTKNEKHITIDSTQLSKKNKNNSHEKI